MKEKITIFFLNFVPSDYHGLSKSEVTDSIKEAHLPRIIEASFNLAQSQYTIVRNEHGKPLIKTLSGEVAYISISHTCDMWVCATAHYDIGIDIEQIRNGRRNVAERYFHPDEKEILCSCTCDEQYNHTFFTLWTAKEAYGKLIGCGVNSGILGSEVCTLANITYCNLAHNHICAIATPLSIQPSIELINLTSL